MNLSLIFAFLSTIFGADAALFVQQIPLIQELPFTVISTDGAKTESSSLVDELADTTAFKLPNEKLCLVRNGIPLKQDEFTFQDYSIKADIPLETQMRVYGSDTEKFCHDHQIRFLKPKPAAEPKESASDDSDDTSEKQRRQNYFGGCGIYSGAGSFTGYPYYGQNYPYQNPYLYPNQYPYQFAG